MSRLKETRIESVAEVIRRMPQGWERDLDTANVDHLVEEFVQTRILPPLKATEDGEIVCGRHRLKAAERAGQDFVRIDIVAYDYPEEAELDSIYENLRRRVFAAEVRSRILRRAVELEKARLHREHAEWAELQPPGADTSEAAFLRAKGSKFSKHTEHTERTDEHRGAPSAASGISEEIPSKLRGRPPGISAAAVAQVADELGVDKSTVRAAVAESPRTRLEDIDPTTLTTNPDAIDGFDLPIPPPVHHRARRVQTLLDEAIKHMRAVSKLVAQLEEQGAPGTLAQNLRNETTALGKRIKGARPKSVCPACKARVRMEDCTWCKGTGYASEADMHGDFEATLLLRGDRARVMDAGTIRQLRSEVRTERRKKGKTDEPPVNDDDGSAGAF